MDSLRGGVRQSRVLSLSYRPEDNRSVRITAISSSSSSNSSTKSSERPTAPDGSTIDPSIDPSASRLHRLKASVQERSKSSLIPPTDPIVRTTDRPGAAGSDNGDGRIIRPLERADSCYWHAAGMLDGRSKSFVLPDRCPARRSHPVGIERPSVSPIPAVIVPSSVSNSAIYHQQLLPPHRHLHGHHPHHHHHHHHEHLHQQHHRQHHHQLTHHQDQQEQRPPLSSSSTSSSFSSTDHIMLPPSPTTPSVITAQTAQPAASRVRAATSSTSRVHVVLYLYLSVSI